MEKIRNKTIFAGPLRWVIPVLILLRITGCNGAAGNKNNGDGSLKEAAAMAPVIEFASDVNNLGVVREGEKVIAWYDFRNTGSAPLIIQNIRAGCGCTVPSWIKTPVIAGDSGVIRVIFDSSGKYGLQNIKVTVLSNANNAEEELYLQANVE